jgi:ribosomal protein S18 acetylase RimI-like enzyme
MEFKIRPLEITDIETIFHQIIDLATHQHIESRVVVTKESLQTLLFNNEVNAPKGIVAYNNSGILGFAVYSIINTNRIFNPTEGIYIEELYVKPEYRGKKIGLALFKQIAEISKLSGCKRLEWWVTKDNISAIEFYNKLGANLLEGILIYRLDEKALESFMQHR